MKILGKQKVAALALAGGSKQTICFRLRLQKHLATSIAALDPFAGTATSRIADNRRTDISFLKLRS